MKTIKILTIVLLSTFALHSCLVEETAPSDAYADGANVLGFLESNMLAALTADGSTRTLTIPLKAVGPNLSDITSDITCDLVKDASSTAIEGTHYTLGSSTVTFSPSQNLITTIELTLMSDGISAPSSESLILNLENSSDPNTIPSGRTGSIAIDITYLCYSNLAGDYTNALIAPDRCDESDPITVTEDSPGRYFVSSMTEYAWTSGGCIGFYIVDNCGTLTYDGGDLEDNGYSGDGGEGGEVNADGSFTFECRLNEVGYSEVSTYVPL